MQRRPPHRPEPPRGGPPGHSRPQGTGRGPADEGQEQTFDIPLPNPLRDAVNAATRSDPGSVNFALRFRRYLGRMPRDPRTGEEVKDKGPLVKLVLREFSQYMTRLRQSRLLEELRVQERQAFEGVYAGARPVTFELRERLAIGLGTASAFDTGMQLHHLLGVPYIPSSSLKGLARATAFGALAEEFGVPLRGPEEGQRYERLAGMLDALLVWRRPETGDAEEAMRAVARGLEGLQQSGLLSEASPLLGMEAAEWAQRVKRDEVVAAYGLAFGSLDRRGVVAFGDAYPKGLQRLEADVINPHFRPYYEDEHGKLPPADYYDPVPAFFFTVPPKTGFTFMLGLLATDAEGPTGALGLLDRVVGWLGEGLATWGIGAKTAVGYGAAALVRASAGTGGGR